MASSTNLTMIGTTTRPTNHNDKPLASNPDSCTVTTMACGMVKPATPPDTVARQMTVQKEHANERRTAV